jgi:glycine/D-amino acid oxidase-like deaminating enzyme
LVGQVRTDLDRVKLAMWSVATFNKFQKNEEVNPNWRQVGSLRLAETPERVEEFKVMENVCKKAGLEMGFISASEANKKWPGMSFEKAKAILWCPSDGYLQPYDLSMTYKHYAREKGVRFLTNESVQSIQLSPA